MPCILAISGRCHCPLPTAISPLWLSSEGAENALKPLLEEAVPLCQEIVGAPERPVPAALLGRSGIGHFDVSRMAVQ
ncbi:hypothetical protein predicted by Glimmer/Critica [Sorangium cellulosum So ce56]|uniref:Uncharacterized protein n=1 Tax=Sorangium cellulosum (strain So ce56) TaxID=448385 RepID=A9FD31_SORC5|nr:hypothetical protein predicted by Glimmer/Critica [Sorangium cellulosum So ce56]